MADTIETKVVNDTENDYELKMGNAGQYRLLRVLKKHEEAVVKCDKNATYREYWVGTAAGIPGAIITSDDCLECTEIKILPSENGRNRLEKTRREGGESTKKKGWVAKLLGK